MTYSSLISSITSIPEKGISATVDLLNSGATIPFIARYRKERTGSLDEVQIAQIAESYHRICELEERKKTILHTIEEQGKLSDSLLERIKNCWDATLLEDIYLPYKPHKKTRADIARELGLEPLAHTLLLQRNGRLNATEQQLQGARDIIAEQISQDERARNAIRREFSYTAIISTRPVRDKVNEPEAQNYSDYMQISESLKRISSHRLLAIRRAESLGFIRVDISADQDKCISKLEHIFIQSNNDASQQIQLAIEDAYKRLLKPAIETEFAAISKQKADDEAIRVFKDNLRQLLLDSPLGQKRVLALDPGFRTGCKMVILSAQGDLLHHDVIYIRMQESAKKLVDYCKKYQIEAIAIGNGTAGRECEAFVRQVLDGNPPIFVVSENGASVYSASAIARNEFPDQDVTVRGAVSIGRRLIDPLAELVKIDPKSIGVGQYQHDVDQVKLREGLNQTVESVVNYVGVDVNTASSYLLTYISGLGPTLAENIVKFRRENGPFCTRKDLLRVPKLGPKTYEQCAGFLRIANGSNPLDNTAVHPESYAIAEQLVEIKKGLAEGEKPDFTPYISSEIGLPTLQDIWQELQKPTRDPRTHISEFQFSNQVHTITDLQEGMELPGIVTNIADFGAFVDIGVHKDGLIHISAMSNKRIHHPSEVLRMHQHVTVRIQSVDLTRQRIQLSLIKAI